MTDSRIIGLMGASHLTSHFLQLALPPLFPLIKTEFGVSYIELGLIVSVFYAASGIGQTVSGFLVDRLGARPVLLTGMGLLAGGVVLFGLSPTYWTMLPIALLAGLGNSVFHPADYSILSASVTRGRLARGYSLHGFGGNIGYMLAPVVVGPLGLHLGWRAALLVAGGLGLAGAAAVASGTRALARRTDLGGHASAGPLLSDVRLLLATPILVAFTYFALIAAAFIGVQTFGVTAMVAIYQAPIALATGALTAFFLGNATGLLIGGLLADRTTRHDVLAVTGMLAASGLMLVMAAAVLPSTLLPGVLSLAGFALGVTSPSRDMLVRSATPSGASGKVFGFVYSGLDLGSLVAPLVYGWLLDRGEPRAVFVTAAVIMAVTIVTVVQVRRRAQPVAAPATGA
jgi:MFS transporter, FSR family, fosmidomycin resistance protein